MSKEEAAELKEEQGAEQSSPSESEDEEVAALRKELEKLTAESQHHLEQWKRAAANLENYRKRAERERSEALKLGQGTLMTQLLPVLDDLQRAFVILPAELRNLTWIDGVALIERKLEMVLMQHGLKEIEALGKPFDPAQHQSILQEATTEHPDGYILAVLQKGYTFNDRVLRPAMVKIARNEAQDKEPATSEEAVAEEEHLQSATDGGQATPGSEDAPDPEQQ